MTSASASPSSIPDAPISQRDHRMFAVVFLFLLSLGLLLSHGGESSDEISRFLVAQGWPWVIGAFWGIIALESLVGAFQAKDGASGWGRALSLILLPPLRLGFASYRPMNPVWFPTRGWLPVEEESSDRVEVLLAIPMIIITLLIIPIAVVEFFFQQALLDSLSLAITFHVLTALVWMAFVMEFVFLLSLSEKKLRFCLKHWMNLLIILLPLIAFLRVLRLTRLVKLLRAGKMIRMYRLKSIYMRTMRVAVLFNLVERVVIRRSPERYLKSLETRIEDHEKELLRLRQLAEDVKRRLQKSE